MRDTMTNFADVAVVEPMVEETLTNDELRDIFLSRYESEVRVYKNARFKNWDGSRHTGAIITVYTGDNVDDYFMERTLHKIYSSQGRVHVRQVWHKLLPIKFRERRNGVMCTLHRRSSPPQGITNICDAILQNVIDDVLMSYEELSLYEATKELVFKDTPKEVLLFQKRADEAKHKLIHGLVPAGDDLWDDLLFGEMTSIRAEVFRELKKRGHWIHLDGEKDSFGWVTCGIVMDGKLMTSQYF